jgi:hypothetical protein
MVGQWVSNHLLKYPHDRALAIPFMVSEFNEDARLWMPFTSLRPFHFFSKYQALLEEKNVRSQAEKWVLRAES